MKFDDIYAFTVKLLDQFWPATPVRLISVKVSECLPLDMVKKDSRLILQKLTKDEHEMAMEKQLKRLKEEVGEDMEMK